MFRKLADLFKNFFQSLFGKRDSAPTPPAKNETLLEDSQDVVTDTVVTIPVPIDIGIANNGPFADPDKDSAIDGPPATNDPPANDNNGSTPEPPPADPVDDGGHVEEPEPPAHTPRYLWCLDNGHGKLQAGKRSPKFDLNGAETQFFEYIFNRDVVKRIMKALDEKGVKYFDVVPDVETVGSFLKERVDRANDEASTLPKLFVSVHSNAGPAASDEWTPDNIKGAETWFANGSKKGKKMAEVFQKHIVAKSGFVNRGLKSTKEKQLYVLVKTSMPAILTENGFYNNEKEVLELMKDSVRQKIADAHVAAIMEIEKDGL